MLNDLLQPLLGPRPPQLTLGTAGPWDLQPVRVPLATLDTHLYVAGKTGTGKSSFLLSLADQLIRGGQGLGLLDPHGDLVSDLLATLASYPVKQPWLSVPANRARTFPRPAAGARDPL
jgi:DNA helicase HerA-like ATPase